MRNKLNNKMKIKHLIAGILLPFIFVSIAVAKEATPMSADPEMEKRVNEISAELRCLVCQNQTIADSSAGLAVDLKRQVRTMVADGQSQDEIIDFMVKRYGDFIRYRPPVKPTTYLLWAGPLLLLLIGFTVLIINLKKRKAVVVDAPLSEDESARIDSMLNAQAKQGSSSNATGDANANKKDKG